MFVRDQGGPNAWGQVVKLTAVAGHAGARFGDSVAIDGDTIVVGAPWEDSDAAGVDGDGSNDLANEAGAAGPSSELRFAIDDDTGRALLRIVDRVTSEVIVQLPPEDALRAAEVLENLRPGDRIA